MGLLLLYAFLSILFSFLCSILEAAFLSFTPSYIRVKRKEGKAYANTLYRLKKNVDEPLIAILTINTIAHTVGAILVGVQAEKIYPGGGNMVGIISALLTFAILVLSEVIPKTIGATYWKSLGSFTANTLKIFIFPLKYTGILWLLCLTTRKIGKKTHASTLSREEFIAITDAAEEEGIFEEKESVFIKNMLLFRSIKAKDIMTPFSVAVTENEETSIEDFYNSRENLKFSRIPVFREKTNNITGFILKDDVLEEMLEEKGKQPLRILRRDVPVVTQETPIPQLFEVFLSQRTHLSIVVDKFGNTVGLVTMEDIIETMLGLEIMDESDNIADMQLLARENWKKRARKLGLIQSDIEEK